MGIDFPAKASGMFIREVLGMNKSIFAARASKALDNSAGSIEALRRWRSI